MDEDPAERHVLSQYFPFPPHLAFCIDILISVALQQSAVEGGHLFYNRPALKNWSSNRFVSVSVSRTQSSV